ncbi:MAG: hypothetical protein AAB921_00105 [Patescibacteria group bacterium]
MEQKDDDCYAVDIGYGGNFKKIGQKHQTPAASPPHDARRHVPQAQDG